MFDKQKIKDLQQRSHNRGLLSKEFYHAEQAVLERKRMEMKRELDRQVEERRRQKELEKMEQDRKIRKEEEEIRNYYQKMENRDKKISINQASQPNNMKMANQPYQTYPNDSYNESRAKAPSQRNRGNSKPSLTFDGDIPLLPVLPNEPSIPAFQSVSHAAPPLANSKYHSNVNSGAIPLLDLSEEPAHLIAAKTKKGKKSKRQKTLEGQKESHIQRVQMSKLQQKSMVNNISNDRDRYNSNNNDRRSTLADEESIVGSVVRVNNSLQKKGLEGESALKEIEQVQYQNQSLRMELKKNQEAVSLLMGALRSNVKLDKFRVQAEKILSNNQMQASMASRKEEEKKDEGLMLPRIQLKHQSIMHDYLLAAARKGKKSLGK